jgi:hypothetical protein
MRICILKHSRNSNAGCAFVRHIVARVPSTSKYASEPTVTFDGRRADGGGACHIEKWSNVWKTTVKTVILLS